MRRPTLAALIVVVGLVLLADYLIVNEALGQLAGVFVDAAILVAAGAALAAVISLALRRANDLRHRRGDPVSALLVLGGMAAMLIAGLRPDATGSTDPAVGWLLTALLIPIGATLFGLLFITTLAAARRSIQFGGREALVLVGVAIFTLILLLPLDGGVGSWLADAAAWSLAVPIGAVFRGILIGVAILTAVVAARMLLGVGPSTDE